MTNTANHWHTACKVVSHAKGAQATPWSTVMTRDAAKIEFERAVRFALDVAGYEHDQNGRLTGPDIRSAQFTRASDGTTLQITTWACGCSDGGPRSTVVDASDAMGGTKAEAERAPSPVREHVANEYEESIADVHAGIERLTSLVDAGTYSRDLLDAYVDAARQRSDWFEPAVLLRRAEIARRNRAAVLADRLTWRREFAGAYTTRDDAREFGAHVKRHPLGWSWSVSQHGNVIGTGVETSKRDAQDAVTIWYVDAIAI